MGMVVKGYKKVLYDELIERLADKRNKSNKTHSMIAVCMGLKDTQTIGNCFAKEAQKVKDSVLTKLMLCLDFDGFVMWVNGERFYYINNKIK